MRVLPILTLLLFVSSSAFTQTNYILNPDFEQKTFCPTQYDQIKYARYWSGIDSTNTQLQSSCIPQYCHTCSSLGFVSVPKNQFGWQYPRSGDGYASSRMTVLDTAGNGGWRDYLQGRLHKKLTAGKRYCVTFYVSLAEGSHQAIADISAYLDNGSIDTTKTCSAAQTKYIPQVTNASGIISDTANWVKIEGSFISNGTEQFITIGNFKDNAHTLSVNMPTTAYSGSVEGSFYSIDDVSVVESDLKADAGPDRHIGNGDSTYIGRPKEVGLECTWFVLGSSTAIGTGAGIWVKPAVSTSYIVTQTLCGGTKKDTVRVEVWAVGVKGIEGKNEQRYSLSPNPNNGTFVLTQSMIVNQTTNTEVYDMLGRSIFNTTVRFRDGKTVLTLKDIDPGIYLLKMGERTDASLRFEVR